MVGKKKCLNCGKLITRYAKRCIICSNKSRKGIPLTEKHKENISESNKGEKNGMWKGDKVSYGALHDYIKWHKPKPKLCEECGKVPP